MAQLQMEPRARKKKKSSKLEFDASQVFGTSKDTEIQMDLDSARYAAQKGEGGDRRALFSPRVSSRSRQPSRSIRRLLTDDGLDLVRQPPIAPSTRLYSARIVAAPCSFRSARRSRAKSHCPTSRARRCGSGGRELGSHRTRPRPPSAYTPPPFSLTKPALRT